MTVTRAQRKKLEKKTVVEESNTEIVETTTAVTTLIEKTVNEKDIPNPLEEKKSIDSKTKDNENIESEEQGAHSIHSVSDDNSLSDNDSSSDVDSSSEDEEDLEDLLNKAEAAATLNNKETELEHIKKRSLSKMNPGISQELYFENTKGRSRLTPNAVQLSGDKTQGDNTALVVEANNRLEKGKSRKERQQEREKTAGDNWFDMPRTEMTPEIKRDLQVLKMRHVLDRKRHYKKTGKQADPKYFQVGRIIEGPTEFFSARMTKKERKQTIVDELLASEENKQYYKRKHEQVSTSAKSGGKRDYKKLKAQRNRLKK